MPQPSVLVALNNETSQKHLVNGLETAGARVEELKTSEDVVTGAAIIEHMDRLREEGNVPNVVVLPNQFGDDDSDDYFKQIVRTLRGRRYRSRVAIVGEQWRGTVVVRSIESGADAILSISASRPKVTAATARNVFDLAAAFRPSLRYELSTHFNAWQAMHDQKNGQLVDDRSLSLVFGRNVHLKMDSLHVRAAGGTTVDAPGIVLFYHGKLRNHLASTLSSHGFNVFSPTEVAEFRRAYLCGDTTVVFDPRAASKYAGKLFSGEVDISSRLVLFSNFDDQAVDSFVKADFMFGEVFALVDELDDFDTIVKYLTGKVEEGERLNGAFVSPQVQRVIRDRIKLDTPNDHIAKPRVVIDIQWSNSYADLLAKTLRQHGLEVVSMETFLKRPKGNEFQICVSGRHDDASLFGNGSESYSGLKFVIVDSLDGSTLREYVRRRDVIGLFDLSDDPSFICSSVEDLADGSVFRFMSRAVRDSARVEEIDIASSFTTF